jgi:hypothetical protein
MGKKRKESRIDFKGKGPATDAECWNCGKKGHLAQNCWSKPRQVAEVTEEKPEKG